ncbi:MAG: ATP-binding cassette domain-containing protein [Ignavibacteria bacterium]|nr:ATP-binding cassette domain-containing protein [Ignavibacteria bacterium]MCU7505021.1 ATP-binding cassette domain-containing protein [Ignavibacteria bacterium]MCU7515339.1 ATP-binding cassette domain-containing protein [Ignavibacteria bacterium]
MAENDFILKAEKISKRYISPAGALSIIGETGFEVLKGELLTILGPPASGKSTLLKILAGIETPDSGSVTYGQFQEVKTDAAFIPSEPSALPWLSVEENIRLGMRAGQEQDTETVRKFTQAVGLNGYEKHIPANKSTGFRFRIALARAMAMEPKLILMDDPLRELLPERKMDYYKLIRQIMSKGDFGVLWATTDITGAMLISDRILLQEQKSGRIVREFHPAKRSTAGIPVDDEFFGMRAEIELFFYS